jgi:ribose 5-phosphate isomerase B
MMRMTEPTEPGYDGPIPAPTGATWRVAIGGDHVGLPLKTALASACRKAGYELLDVGVHETGRVDYNDVAVDVVRLLTTDKADIGILVCGTGAGMQIAANRYPQIRAVAVNDLYTAYFARSHNDANIACLGSRLVAPDLAIAIMARFLATPFEGGRHQRRVDKLSEPPTIGVS